ncbi:MULTISPECIES: aminotransferase [Mycobacterium]|uniref:4-aminobutyrate aminotransferase n=1 Tax=Mycobacterium pseudoshottsii TaxID=265949 RepID=A0A9N7LR45_9MYCO|nr:MULTISPECIES: aminotransferase [Mycobacterium]BDN82021.1 4-aminobutyrate aminotransferase [Mycobacterium pseudoshottsii]BEH76418.1 4-aminobutyrate aminotransferase [Mycobacterium pseudoshottsii]
MKPVKAPTGFDFFAHPELPGPPVNERDAEKFVVENYEISACARSLGSQQDANFLMTDPHGNTVGVLKVANAVFSTEEIDAQVEAVEWVAERDSALRLPRAIPDRRGQRHAPMSIGQEMLGVARLLTFLPGGAMSQSGYLAPKILAGMGNVTGRVSRALASFEHPGLDRVLQWDPRFASESVDALIGHVAEPAEAHRLAVATATAVNSLQRLDPQLPRQAVHLDIADTNMVGSPGSDGRRHPDGVIDFGDLTKTWAIAELATTVASCLYHAGAEPATILPVVAAFHAIRPLSGDEIEALWPMVIARAAVLLVSDLQQIAIDPGNEYAANTVQRERVILDQALLVPAPVMTGLIRDRLGIAQPQHHPLPKPHRPIIDIDPKSIVRLDFSVESDAANRGAWLDGALAHELADSALSSNALAAATRYAATRADYIAPLHPRSSPTIATGIDFWLREDTELVAPWAGDVVASTGAITLRTDSHELQLTGAEPVPTSGQRVQAGQPWAKAPFGQRIHLALRPTDAPTAPHTVRPEYAPGWLAVTEDPAALLGLEPAPSDGLDVLERRAATFAEVQEHYYDDPPQIERGWRHYLLSTAGRSYLDMVNNVTVLGHAHPGVAAAAARQLERLNTNSRFNYAVVVEFCERLTQLLPDPLDTVFLVNSGSKAGDLALRLAMAATGRRDVVAVGEAYHGWTYATDAVSTSTADNPNALNTRPDWVHTVESPNSFRGKYRGAGASQYAHDAVAAIEDLVQSGRAPAAFIAETVYGSAGGMALPDGYLDAVYTAIRAAGGLTIADEVQVGYGRLGKWFWGFEQQGVVPDIVAIAKATGNGHPVGAVITSKAIAQRFRSQGYFFSSTGGSPLSSAIGIAVLDALKSERLQHYALAVGSHLIARIRKLATKHPLIGTVHGFGLYIGVEMVRDRKTLEPAAEETAAICDRMLELGVIIQPTGERMNILKTKPPLCIDMTAADYFADTLDRVLTEGW